jgi:hypothetical protein
MTTHLSERTLNAVEAALSPQDGQFCRQVAARIDHLAPVTVRHALRELVLQGRASFLGGDGRRLYLRVVRS